MGPVKFTNPWRFFICLPVTGPVNGQHDFPEISQFIFPSKKMLNRATSERVHLQESEFVILFMLFIFEFAMIVCVVCALCIIFWGCVIHQQGNDSVYAYQLRHVLNNRIVGLVTPTHFSWHWFQTTHIHPTTGCDRFITHTHHDRVCNVCIVTVSEIPYPDRTLIGPWPCPQRV